MIEEDHAVEQHERVVEPQLEHAAAESDGVRPSGGSCDKDVWRGDVLPTGAVVLADPHLGEAERIEELDELKIAFERVSWV